MKPLRDLIAGLLMLAVLLAALFGVWAAVSPEKAKGIRDRAVRAADRLTRDDNPPEMKVGTTGTSVRSFLYRD
jgi:hypothetical protein